MKRIGIIVGHEPTKRGASNPVDTEYDFNNSLAPHIASELKANGFEPVIIHRTNGYNALPKNVNKTGVDIAISLHCNAFNTKASGCEVLYYHTSSRSKKLAQCLQTELLKCLGNADRGIKSRVDADRGGYLLKQTSMPCVIAEPFFIDNMTEYNNAKQRFNELAKAYASAVTQYFKD